MLNSVLGKSESRNAVAGEGEEISDNQVKHVSGSQVISVV